MEESREKEFIIRDRRSAMSESSSASDTAKDAGTQKPTLAEPKPAEANRTAEEQKSEPLSELDFSAFIFSLATTAQVNLGVIPNPQTNLQARNLPAAKQMIDIIGMLKEKTSGNLSQDEQTLVDSILYNLRMQYVKTMEGGK